MNITSPPLEKATRESIPATDDGEGAVVTMEQQQKEDLDEGNTHVSGEKQAQDCDDNSMTSLRKAMSEASIADMLQQEHSNLSPQEQEYFDDLVHGNTSFSPLQETPELLRHSLKEMEVELTALPESQKESYTKALTMNGGAYVRDTDHRLKFLRAEAFDAKQAAVRFCAWLDVLEEMFGEVALTRKICLSDLSKDDMAAMKSGMFQPLPSRDRIGRRVISIVLGDNMKTLSVHRQTKAALYILTWISDDLTTQRSGIVRIFRPTADFNVLFPSLEDFNYLGKLYRAFPLRPTGIHVCVPGSPLVRKLLRPFFSRAQTTDNRLVTKLHVGSDLETTYVLQTEYGIPSKEIQCTETGRMKVKNLNNWLKFRTKVEERKQMSIPFEGIDCPDFQTIAIRSGGSMFNHPPNKLFRSYLKELEEEWCKASKTVEKQRVISKIVDAIQGRGFRYVKWSDSEGCYMPLKSPDDIRCFVATSLRDQIKRTKAKRSLLVQRDVKSGDFFFSPQEKKARIEKK
ncbi:MAG: hypothetical protein SGILL_002451 [Bacillariaceae sp.]